jgi:transcriptional regulator with XRE-family HTH domain
MDMTFANRFQSRRIELGLSQGELAQILGVTQAAVSYYESGSRQPRISFLALIAQTLKMKMSDLLGEN